MFPFFSFHENWFKTHLFMRTDVFPGYVTASLVVEQLGVVAVAS